MTGHEISIPVLAQQVELAVGLPNQISFSLLRTAMVLVSKGYYSPIVLGVAYLGGVYTYIPDVFA